LLSVLVHFVEDGRWGAFVKTAVEGQSLTAEDQLFILMQALPDGRARNGSTRSTNLLRARRAVVSFAWSSAPRLRGTDRSMAIYVLAVGAIFCGWARSASGNTAEGIPWIEQGIRDFRAIGSVIGRLTESTFGVYLWSLDMAFRMGPGAYGAGTQRALVVFLCSLYHANASRALRMWLFHLVPL
jgi:hypothetical protein